MPSTLRRLIPWPRSVPHEPALKIDWRYRFKMALSDLLVAVRGHLRGEDWDKEMEEALLELEEGRRMIKGKGKYKTRSNKVATVDGKDGSMWLGQVGKLRTRWRTDGTCSFGDTFHDIVKVLDKGY
ncbi:MAG: hypothetical protein COA78_20375 [Blastopirellula sp.]|nr:MAG: hypothetical protein COA78_20375 [Blastopirellula sp.]